MQLYNTLTRQKEEFIPSTTGRVGMYVCGPTVYSEAHLGHAKAQVTFDVIRRYLIDQGYKVRFVSNITDVGHITDENSDDGHDRIGNQAKLEQIEPMEVADKYYWLYFDDMQKLNVLRPDISPRATGHIPEQIALTQELLENGYAYEVNGSVYFSVASYEAYGKLSGRKIEELHVGTREDVREEKRDPRDFALWKKAEKGHLMRWDSPWGEGFPGWHIECSAMSLKYLGEGFDIHGGGMDLQFPHHEAEIAQSEAAGHPFARYWLHNNMVTVNNEKMSRSKGNFTTLKELYQKYSPMTLRFLIVSSHYRSITEFADEPIKAAENGYKRLKEALGEARRRLDTAGSGRHEALEKSLVQYTAHFVAAMNDDFNTPEAVAALFNLTRDVNSALSGEVGRETLQNVINTYERLGAGVLGLFAEESEQSNNAQVVDTLMELVIDARHSYRQARAFDKSDALREKLAEVGIVLEDTLNGTRFKLQK